MRDYFAKIRSIEEKYKKGSISSSPDNDDWDFNFVESPETYFRDRPMVASPDKRSFYGWPGGGEPLRLDTAEPWHMDIRINLRRPLREQFKFFEDLAGQSQKSWNKGWTVAKRPERSRPYWPLFLRIIDAEDHGQNFKQIGDALDIREGWEKDDESRILRDPRSVGDLRDRARVLTVSWPY